MAERSRFDRLEPALAAIARELADLPRAEFKENLRNELKGKATMASMATKVSPVPKGYHTATPYLIVHDAVAAIDFYRRAFGAAELFRVNQPDGRIGHAEIQIGDSHIMLADEHPEAGIYSARHYGGSPVTLLLYVEDVDAIFARAVAAGARVDRPLADQPYGDRNGGVIDPFGHRWFVATHIKDVPPPPQPTPWVPEGFHSITPYVQVNGAAQFIDFLRRAFGAEEAARYLNPDGTVLHAQVRIGDSPLELADAGKQYPPTPAPIRLYVPGVDAVYQRALDAGAKSIEPPQDQFYGSRDSAVLDPFGNHWYIATNLHGPAVPPGMHSITPYLHPRGAARFIDFVQQAFGAEELHRVQGPDGTIHHAQLRIGSTDFGLGEAHGPYQPMPAALHVYVPDVDAAYERALRAGAATMFAPRDEPYGDRACGLTDPFGHTWYLATRKSGPAAKQ